MKITWNWYELDINISESNAEKTIAALNDIAVAFTEARDDCERNEYHNTANHYQKAFEDICIAIDEIKLEIANDKKENEEEESIMLNEMEIERIENESARQAAEGTAYDWTDLLDNTEQYRKVVKREKMNADRARGYFEQIFADMIEALKASDIDQ